MQQGSAPPGPGTQTPPAHGQQTQRRQPAQSKTPPEPDRSAQGSGGAAGNARAGRAGAGGSRKAALGGARPPPSPAVPGRAGLASPRALPPPARRPSLARMGAPSARYLIKATTLMLLTGPGRGREGERAVTLPGSCVTAAKRSREGARPPRPPWAAHAAGCSVATATDLAASPQQTLLPGQAGRLPEQEGGAAGPPPLRAQQRHAASAAALRACRGGGARAQPA